MYFLGIDTSTKTCSIAVTKGGSLVTEMTLCNNLSHSRKLLSLIDDTLEKSGTDIRHIDGIAVSTGPGSFTGLRIGIGTVKGLCMAAPKPIIGVSTLEVLSYPVSGHSSLICPLLDARKKEVYTSFFKYKNNKLTRLSEDMVISPLELLKKIDEKTVFIGEGAEVYRNLISEKLNDLAVFLPKSFNQPRGVSVAEVGMMKYKEGELLSLHDLKPAYIRRSEAEIKWEEKEKRQTILKEGDVFMNKEEIDIIKDLKKEDKEFSQLMKEHEDLEKKLEKINKLKFLTPEQEIEKKRIQKLKLKGKDRMAEIISTYRSKKDN
jgi:tRNA threonylcarbamoyladenosine biosynthesis protein TsaB